MNLLGYKIISLRRFTSSVWAFCWVRAVPEHYVERLADRRHFGIAVMGGTNVSSL